VIDWPVAVVDGVNTATPTTCYVHTDQHVCRIDSRAAR
jgi:hypothetical protein